jgi:hypothetical protein
MFMLSSGFNARRSVEVLRARRCPRLLPGLLAVLFLVAPALAFVFTYEANVYPIPPAWERIVTGTPERRLEDGWLIQTVVEGEQDDYSYDLGGISSLVGRFFVEWRAVTDYPEWLIDDWQTPTALAAGGMGGVLYHVVMTESAAVLLRDIYIPRVIVPISAGEPHTYRVEVYSDEYVWYIDGVVVDSGVPEGPYPDPNAFVAWGTRGFEGMTNTTAWDYVRFGEIAEDASGDYDSKFGINLGDYRFVHECLTNDGPGLFGGPDRNAGPGCRFTDFDDDGDVDLRDFADFQIVFTGFDL